jgi:hypothetical protein
VHLKDNPFTELPSWKGKLRLFGIAILKEAKVLGKQEVKEEDLSEKEEESKKQPVRDRERRPFNFGSYRDKFMAGLPPNYEQDFYDVPAPELAYPPGGFLIESAQHVNNLIPVDRIEFDEGGSELNIEIEGNEDEDLALVGDEEGSEDFGGEENEEGED